MAGSGHQVFQRIQLHHVAHSACRDDSAGHIVSGWPDHDPQIDCLQDRSVGASRRAANAFDQGRYPDHGRCADINFHCDHYLVVGRPAESLCVGRTADYAGFWCNRLGR